MPEMMFSKNLKHLMYKNCMGYASTAREIGVRKNTVHNWVNREGSAVRVDERVLKLCALFEVTLDQIFTKDLTQ